MPLTTSTCAIVLRRDPAAPGDVPAALAQGGFAVSEQPLGAAIPLAEARFAVVVIDAAVDAAGALRLCQRLRQGGDEPFLPLVVVTADGAAEARRAALESGADAVVPRPVDAAALIAQLRALIRVKDRHELLAARAAEAQRVNKRLQAAYQQIDQELELARRIQQSFLPQTLPDLPRARCAVRYRPCGHVGGDFYDLFRLDEQHLGLYVADAMGHGVPASLLTIFVKTTVKPKDITGQSYRLVPPDEVLQRLNREMIDQQLSETPFITMAYLLFNYRSGEVRFARAGHPHPLHLPANGPSELWTMEGSLLGVFDTHYRARTRQLQPGDRLLLYTDGIDAASFGQSPVGLPSLLAAAEAYRQLPLDDMVGRLAGDLFSQTRQTDDLTILGLEWV